MKRTPLRRIGKQGRINQRANRILKKKYAERGITRCELGFDGCTGSLFLGFAHRYERVEYIGDPDRLADFNETLLACTNCHQKIEGDRELTDTMFRTLRNVK